MAYNWKLSTDYTSAPSEEEDENREKKLCGGRFKSVPAFTVIVVASNLLLAAVVTYLGACTSTLEKRFQLKSSQTAIFFTLQDTIGLFTVLFVIYYGQKRNRSRVLGALYSICALGSIISAMPHFLYDLPKGLQPSTFNETIQYEEDVFCKGQREEEVCDNKDNEESGPLLSQVWWILLGQVFVSFSSAVFPLIISCIDDKVSKRNSPMLVALMFTTFPIGATIGYMLATISLKLPVTFPEASKDTWPIGEDDPRYVGAWWFGFLLTGAALIVVSFPLFFFVDRHPLKSKKGRSVHENGHQEKSDTLQSTRSNLSDVSFGFKMPEVDSDEGLVGFIKGLLKSVMRVLSNFTVMAMIASTCSNTASLAGGRAFGPKYIQNILHLDPSRSAMLTGIVIIPCGFLGTLGGGFIVRKFNLQRKGKAVMILILHTLCFITTLAYLFIGCPTKQIAGLTVDYWDQEKITANPIPMESDLNSMCNSDCACKQDWQPVCGSDGVSYATPCYAGCTDKEEWGIDGKNQTVFTNCRCIPPKTYAPSFARMETCDEGCDKMWIAYITVNIMYFILITLAANPGLMLQIRSVEERDRSVMMGISNVLMKIFGFIPGPLIFGTIIERACILFQTSCGKTGNCLVYDLRKLRLYFYGLVTSLRFIDMVAVILVFASVWCFKSKTENKAEKQHARDSRELEPL